MSDFRKWLSIVEDNLRPNQTVQINPEFGGGIARVMGTNGSNVNVDAKGTALEIPLNSVLGLGGTDPLAQDYDEFQKTNIETPATDHPECQTGDMVLVKNVYGTGTGDGYGVFAGYSTDGTRALVDFDGEIKDLPVGMVVPSTIQTQKDEFAATGSNGSQSPLSINAFSGSDQCGCHSYDCNTCFPPLQAHATANTQQHTQNAQDLAGFTVVAIDGDDSEEEDNAFEPLSVNFAEPDEFEEELDEICNMLKEDQDGDSFEDKLDMLNQEKAIDNVEDGEVDESCEADPEIMEWIDRFKRV